MANSKGVHGKMKKYLLSIIMLAILLYSFTSSAYAEMPIIATSSATIGTNTQIFGSNNGSHPAYIAYKLITSDQALELCVLNIKIKYRTAQNSDDLYVKVYKGGTYAENGTLITSSNYISGYNVGATETPISFAFGSSGYLGIGCQGLEANTTYWLDVHRSGSIDANGYYMYADETITTPNEVIHYSATGQLTGCGGGSGTCYLYGSVLGYGGSYATGSGSLNFNFAVPQMNCGALQAVCDGMTNTINFLIGLVIPAYVDTEVFTGLKENVYTKAPIAYLSTAMTLGLSAGTTATLSAITIPWTTPEIAGIAGKDQNITMTLPTFMLNFNGYVKNVLGIFFWFMFIMYLIFRFREKVL
jgi:hypothetical protein